MKDLKNKPVPTPVSLVLTAVFIIWFSGIETAGKWLWVEVDGTITQTHYTPEKNAPRYVTEYTLRDVNGKNLSYIAGPTDASLPRDLPVGTQIKKQKWNLSYERDGVLVNDFPVGFYSGLMGLALGLIVWAILQWRGQRAASKLS